MSHQAQGPSGNRGFRILSPSHDRVYGEPWNSPRRQNMPMKVGIRVRGPSGNFCRQLVDIYPDTTPEVALTSAMLQAGWEPEDAEALSASHILSFIDGSLVGAPLVAFADGSKGDWFALEDRNAQRMSARSSKSWRDGLHSPRYANSQLSSRSRQPEARPATLPAQPVEFSPRSRSSILYNNYSDTMQTPHVGFNSNFSGVTHSSVTSPDASLAQNRRFNTASWNSSAVASKIPYSSERGSVQGLNSFPTPSELQVHPVYVSSGGQMPNMYPANDVEQLSKQQKYFLSDASLMDPDRQAPAFQPRVSSQSAEAMSPHAVDPTTSISDKKVRDSSQEVIAESQPKNEGPTALEDVTTKEMKQSPQPSSTGAKRLKVALGKITANNKLASSPSVRKLADTPTQNSHFSDTVPGVEDVQQSKRVLAVPFSPNGLFFLFWMNVVWLAIMWDGIVTPFQLSFEPPFNSSFEFTDILVNSIFIADIFINFATGFVVDGEIERSGGKVAMNYISGWFFPDVLVAFPWDVAFAGRSTRVVKLLRILRQLRLAKLAKQGSLRNRNSLVTHFSSFEARIKAAKFFQKPGRKHLRKKALVMARVAHQMHLNFSDVARDFSAIGTLIKYFLVVLWISHLHACFFFYLGNIPCSEGKEVPSLVAWVFDNGFADPGTSWVCAAELHDKKIFTKYIYSLYFAFATFSTVGFGDIHPTNIAEMMFVSYCTLFGATIFAFVVSRISSSLIALSSKDAKAQQMMEDIDEWLDASRINSDLAFRVRAYFQFYIAHRGVTEEANILTMLPAALRSEVENDTYTMQRSMLCQVPFLYSKLLPEESRQRSLSIIESLVGDLKEQFCVPGEVVIPMGSTSSQLLFVWKGVLKVVCQRKTRYVWQYGMFNVHGAISEESPFEVSVPEDRFCQLLLLDVDKLKLRCEEHGRAWAPVAAEIRRMARVLPEQFMDNSGIFKTSQTAKGKELLKFAKQVSRSDLNAKGRSDAESANSSPMPRPIGSQSGTEMQELKPGMGRNTNRQSKSSPIGPTIIASERSQDIDQPISHAIV